MSRRRKIRVRKASGKTENFNVRKLRTSLLRSGAEARAVDTVIAEVLDSIDESTTTKDIYRTARSRLGRRDQSCSLRYTLKSALFRLGPTGYPFEHYVADIFKNYGYRTWTGQIVRGTCVPHEVDVLAVSDSRALVMECKYHNTKGTTTDLKAALYVHSRVEDLRAPVAGKHPGRSFGGLLVTNTRLTSDALAYAECRGLGVLSWRYPEERGLEKMIEERQLYPVTIIQGIQAGIVRKLINERILLLKDLLTIDGRLLQRRLGVSAGTAQSLKRRAEVLCG
jgi:hypothetical protein